MRFEFNSVSVSIGELNQWATSFDGVMITYIQDPAAGTAIPTDDF